MELSDFVARSLSDIVEGVEKAQSSASESGAAINPQVSRIFAKSQTGGTNLALGWTKTGGLIHLVEFDVAVTAAEGKKTKGGIGVIAGVFALGSQGESHESNSAISRIKFKVPISFPLKKT
jgi:hypothetical protein